MMINHGSIKTRYIRPTDARSSRIRVTYKDVSTTVPYNHDVDDAHAYAVAQVLAVPVSQLVYRDDWKVGKYFDLLEAPPKEHEFAFYVMTSTAKIAGFNSELLAVYFIDKMDEIYNKEDMIIFTSKQVQEQKGFY